VTSPAHRLLNLVATRVKGADYRVDDRIGVGYLIGLAIERIAMKVRGYVRFPRSSPFIGRGVTIKSRGSLSLGSGVTFGHHAYVDALSTDGVRLGDNTSLGRNTRIECTGSLRHIGRGIRVGDDVGLGSDCLYGCAGGIEIGDDTIVGNFVTFHSENHVIDELQTPIRLQGVTHQGIRIGSNCWIGAKATVLDGVELGDGTVIAAGAVVRAGRYEGNAVYGGVPAKLLKRR
jgi:acetyltransferase-like isoleucine patch superfamily enzyme